MSIQLPCLVSVLYLDMYIQVNYKLLTRLTKSSLFLSERLFTTTLLTHRNTLFLFGTVDGVWYVFLIELTWYLDLYIGF